MPAETNRSVAILKVGRRFVAGVFTDRGLYATSIPRKSLVDALKAVNGVDIERDDNPEHTQVLSKIIEIMDGIPVELKNIRFDFSDLTPNQLKVIKALLRIPRGKTITYGELAKQAKLPGAARFVGNVMANNRFAPLVPCHRVLSSSGLGGYGFGLETKKELLRREGVI